MVEPLSQPHDVRQPAAKLPPPASLRQFSAVDENVFRSAMPETAEDFQFLAAIGVAAIISLEELPDEAKSLARAAGLTVTAVPLSDVGVPRPKQVRAFLRALGGELDRGHKVLIHCSAGLHRTALMAGFYLISAKGLEPLRAYWEVDKRYLGDKQNFKEFLLEFGAQLLNKRNHVGEPRGRPGLDP